MSIPRRWKGVLLLIGGLVAALILIKAGSVLAIVALAVSMCGFSMTNDYAFGRRDE